MDERKLCLLINERMPRGGLFTGAKRWVHPKSNVPWRISPEPFWLSQDEVKWFERLGDHFLNFYKACNILYSQSVRGILPKWISGYPLILSLIMYGHL